MATEFVPWEVHPGLTLERLQVVAQLIRRVRADVVALHDPENGDSPWSLGCRAYSRICHEIARAAKTEHSAWLSVVEPDMHFVFSIVGVPLRFYRGDHESPPARTLMRRFPELRCQQLAFEFLEKPQGDVAFRIAVETNGRGEVESVYLVKVDLENDTVTPWRIPLEEEVSVTSIDLRRDGVVLPPVEVEVPEVDTDTLAANE